MMTTADDLRVSAEELHEVASQLRRQGKPIVVLDGEQVSDRASFVEVLRRAVPLDPPLATGRSLDAIADSLFGGLASVQPAALLWDKAWLLGEADADELDRLLDVLADVKEQLAAPRPAGASLVVEVLAAVRPPRDLRRAFFEDLAVIRDYARSSAQEALAGSRPASASTESAFELLRSKLTSAEEVEAFAAAVEDFVDVALHSALVAIDGGTASAEVGRVQLVDEAGESLGEGLHELFVDHLFDTGRME